jgi:hypothetical protein
MVEAKNKADSQVETGFPSNHTLKEAVDEYSKTRHSLVDLASVNVKLARSVGAPSTTVESKEQILNHVREEVEEEDCIINTMGELEPPIGTHMPFIHEGDQHHLHFVTSIDTLSESDSKKFCYDMYEM